MLALVSAPELPTKRLVLQLSAKGVQRKGSFWCKDGEVEMTLSLTSRDLPMQVVGNQQAG